MNEEKLTTFFKRGNISISNLLLANYHEIGMTNSELLVFLHIQSLMSSEQIKMPSNKTIARKLRITEQEVSDILQQMIEKKIMTIDPENDSFDFSELYFKLLSVEENNIANSAIEERPTSEKSKKIILDNIESEFGRVLSGFELQTVSDWIEKDKFDPELLLLALKEAVLNNVRNLNYISAILTNWERNNIKTKQQAVIYSQERKQSASQKVKINNKNNDKQLSEKEISQLLNEDFYK